jgi:hypothetical protein
MQTKRQHYVPQFLLRRFALEGNRLCVFDKHKYETRVQSVGNSAVEKYFYNYQEEDQFETLEDDLARLEYDSAKTLQEIVASKSLAPIAKSEQRVLAFFVATQMLRTRHKREHSKRHWDVLKQVVTSEEFRESWIGNLEENWDTTEIDFAQHQMSNMKLMAPFFCAILEDYRWFLLLAPNNDHFFISDHPAIVWNSSTSQDVGLGLLEEGAEVYMPVASRLSLLIVEPNCRMAAMGNVPLGVKDKSTLEVDSKTMRLLNGLQVVFSECFVFACSSDFELAREVLEYNHEWRTGPKPGLDEMVDFLRPVK